MSTGLFRQEAIEQQTDRLHGDVLLLPRVSHSLLITLLFVWILAVAIWLVTCTYARKETVAGWLEPPTGITRIYAEDTGIIKQILIAEGESVMANQPLMIVNGDRMLADGDNLENRLLNEYERQRQLLDEQLARTHSIFQRRDQDVTQRIAAAEEDLMLLSEQLVTLNERHNLIKTQVGRYRRLRQEGHVSSLEMDTAIAQELALRNEKQALLREQVNRQNLIQQLQTEQELLPDENATALDQIRTRLSDIAQQIAQLHGQRAHIIKASRAGVISNLQAREGQHIYIGSTTPLLTLIPEDTQLSAHLLIPVRAAGFVKLGQQIDIRYDAFPYQKFGLYHGEITQVSNTVLLPGELLNAASAVQEPVYRITATLAQPHVQAYGQDFSLKPGMTLSADVRLQERSLLQWLLEPIYSLRGRL